MQTNQPHHCDIGSTIVARQDNGGMLHFCENGSNMFLAHVIPIFRSTLVCFPKILVALEDSSLMRDGTGFPGRSKNGDGTA
jgi:hypothetical protein